MFIVSTDLTQTDNARQCFCKTKNMSNKNLPGVKYFYKQNFLCSNIMWNIEKIKIFNNESITSVVNCVVFWSPCTSISIHDYYHWTHFTSSLHNTKYYGIYDTNVFRPKYGSGKFFETSDFMNSKIMEGMYIYIYYFLLFFFTF